ncbi:RICIN domain-containing protein, partial [Streptomyces sp. NPDC005728]|uniref:RICIN domain-containing protein n=1 Tax=Streptomyces sp. NPDC005728 TaxID=3157054 RepID=UPI0033EB88CC
FVKATLKPRKIIWFGSKEQRPYTLSVLRSGSSPLAVEGTYVQRGFLPRWLATFLGVVMALAVTFVMLWIAYKPNVSSRATEKVAAAGQTLAPSPTPSPVVSAPAPEHSAPVQGGGESEKPAGTSGGSGGGSDPSGSGGDGGTSTGTKPDPKPRQPPQAVGQLIIGQASNRCIDVPDAQNGKGKDGTQLQLRDCAGTANQKWDFRGDGTLRSVGMCMDVAWGSKDDGAHIQLARCSGNPAQQFVLSQAGDLVNPQANKCVDAMDNGTGNGTKLQLWTCSGTPNQKWRVQD